MATFIQIIEIASPCTIQTIPERTTEISQSVSGGIRGKVVLPSPRIQLAPADLLQVWQVEDGIGVAAGVDEVEEFTG